MKTIKFPSNSQLGLLLAAALCPSVSLATDFEISDGGILSLTTDLSSDNSVFSTTANTSSSAEVILNANGIGLGASIADYYGYLKVGDGYQVYLTSTGSLGGKVVMDNSYTATTTLVKRNGAFAINGYDYTDLSLVVGRYAVLDLTDSSNTGELTLARGVELYWGSYSGLIKFKVSTPDSTTGIPTGARVIRVLNGNISTTDMFNGGQIDASEHISVDLSGVSGSLSPSSSYTFTLARGSESFDVVGTPIVAGGSDMWSSIGMSTGSNGSEYYMAVTATFSPLFQGGSSAYYGALATLLSGETSGTLLKNWTMSGSATFANHFSLGLGAHTLDAGNNTFTIGAGKRLTLDKQGGSISNLKISFSDSTSTLQLLGSFGNLSGLNFDLSSATGILELGDGTSATSLTITQSSLSSKIGKVKVNSNAYLTVQ